jgi:hypothetical protein
MVNTGRAALAGIQERGQVLGVDLRQIHSQNSAHSTAQSRIGFLPQVDGQQLNLIVPATAANS